MWNPISEQAVMADFWAPRPNGVWRKVLSPLRKFYLKKFYAVASVELSIQKDGGANSCWDGTNAAGHFTAGCPNYVTASGTTSWSAALGTGALVDGSSYAITVQTSDSATNANTDNSG